MFNIFDSNNNLVYNEYSNGYYLGNKNNPYLVLVEAKTRDITSCIVNENCKIINANAFSGCSNLTSVTIGSNVSSIGDNAFYDCSNITEVNYIGTEEEWEDILIGVYNDALTSENITYKPSTKE